MVTEYKKVESAFNKKIYRRYNVFQVNKQVMFTSPIRLLWRAQDKPYLPSLQ